VNLYTSSSLNELYNFRQIIDECISSVEVADEAIKSKRWSNQVFSLIILDRLFGIKEYDEQKYIEILNMPIYELYDKMVIAGKQWKMQQKLNRLAKDFE
jgi:hypothetical protein